MGNQKKLLNTIALCLGIALVLVGIVFLFLDDDHTGSNNSGIVRASTSIEFGADYYTTSAQYAGLAANALCDIFVLLQSAFAFLFIFLGGLDICVFLAKVVQMDETTPNESKE